jgi:lysophospholipase L1-like esterase
MARMQEQQIEVVLVTPAAIGERTDFSNELDGDLNNYSKIIRQLAKKNNLPLVDLRQRFLEYNMKHNTENKESGILTSDKVHLNEMGNEFVAKEMWEVIKSL